MKRGSRFCFLFIFILRGVNLKTGFSVLTTTAFSLSSRGQEILQTTGSVQQLWNQACCRLQAYDVQYGTALDFRSHDFFFLRWWSGNKSREVQCYHIRVHQPRFCTVQSDNIVQVPNCKNKGTSLRNVFNRKFSHSMLLITDNTSSLEIARWSALAAC